MADPARERAEKAASEIGVKALTDYHAGLDEVDAAFVLVPHHLHHPVTLDCLRAGLDVLVEKPLAVTLDQADEMIETADRLGRVLMVAYPHRYRRSMRLLKQAIEGGRYGRLIMLDAMMDESLRGYALGWLAKKATLGGGLFFSASPHMLDVLFWIGGEVKSLSMVGTHGGIPMEGEDTAASIMKFASGVIGVTRHTWASPRCRIWYTLNAMCEGAHVTLTTTPLGDLAKDGVKCAWRTRVVALGEAEEVLLESDEGLEMQPEDAHFLDCLGDRRRPETDGRAARRIMELVFQAYREAAC